MIKIRVRYANATRLVTIESDNGNLLNLKEAIRNEFNVENFELSLNRRTTLNGDDHILSELGIVSGDLVYVLTHVDNHIAQESRSREVIVARDENVLPAPSNPCTSSAYNNAENLQDPCSANCNGTSTVNTQIKQSEERDHAAIQHQEVQLEEPVPLDSETNRYLKEPILIWESTATKVSHTLETCFKNNVHDIQDKHDALFLVLHLLTLETGFDLKDNNNTNAMPNNWKQSGGIKKILYKSFEYNTSQAQSVSLLYMVLGNVAKVYCTVDGSDENYSCQLNPDDYVKQVTSDAHTTYTNLNKLSVLFKDKVSYMVLQSLHKETVPNLLTVLNLSFEIQILVLKNLSAEELLKLSLVNRQLQICCNEPVLWRRLYLLQFGRRRENNEEADGNSLDQDWKSLYKSKHIERGRRIADHRWFRTGHYPTPLLPPHPGLPMPTPGFLPGGIIGGDLDRDPFLFGGIPHPLGGPAAPLGGPRFLRPRFDPVGPLGPDQRFMRPGRGGGMWENAPRNNPGGFRNGGGGFGSPRFF